MNPATTTPIDSIKNTIVPNLGAVVLSGGSSRRMGRDKSQLLFRGRTLLENVVERVARVCHPIVVAGIDSFDYQNSKLTTSFVTDQYRDCGPLEGIRAGLACLAPSVNWAFVSACDAPEINPDLIRWMTSFIEIQDESCEAIIPVDGDRIYGLTAMYRTNLAAEIESLIQSGERRVKFLASHFKATLIDVRQFSAVDRALDSFANINDLADYQRLLERESSG